MLRKENDTIKLKFEYTNSFGDIFVIKSETDSGDGNAIETMKRNLKALVVAAGYSASTAETLFIEEE